jgi:large subunit ribosomal protein L6
VSRVGYQPIKIPEGVEVELQGNEIVVKGPKGMLQRQIHPSIQIEIMDGEVRLQRVSEEKTVRSIHGLTRTLINNMIKGVVEGFTKELELSGVGYRASLKDRRLTLLLGYSHPILFEPPQGVDLEVPDPTHIKVFGIDKELVSRIAAKIRAFRPPDPYKAKGIRYQGEYIRRKVGKAGI